MNVFQHFCRVREYYKSVKVVCGELHIEQPIGWYVVSRDGRLQADLMTVIDALNSGYGYDELMYPTCEEHGSDWLEKVTNDVGLFRSVVVKLSDGNYVHGPIREFERIVLITTEGHVFTNYELIQPHVLARCLGVPAEACGLAAAVWEQL